MSIGKQLTTLWRRWLSPHLGYECFRKDHLILDDGGSKLTDAPVTVFQLTFQTNIFTFRRSVAAFQESTLSEYCFAPALPVKAMGTA